MAAAFARAFAKDCTTDAKRVEQAMALERGS